MAVTLKSKCSTKGEAAHVNVTAGTELHVEHGPGGSMVPKAPEGAINVDGNGHERHSYAGIESAGNAEPEDNDGEELHDQMAADPKKQRRCVANAFGKESPNWNLPFPQGNLTAAEIVTYCPHWLKSIDVIRRFIANGATPKLLANMITNYRQCPHGSCEQTTIYKMIGEALKHAEETKGTPRRQLENQWRTHDPEEFDLDVSNFRCPRITHPKAGVCAVQFNKEQPSIPFADLALCTKEHPSVEEYDGLDLTRCVEYCLNHPSEKWLFPSDFIRLLEKLGGPRPATPSHSDRACFTRHLRLTQAIASATDSRRRSGVLNPPHPHRQPGPRSLGSLSQPQQISEPLDRNIDAPDTNLLSVYEVAMSRRSARVSATPINYAEDSTDDGFGDSGFEDAKSISTRRVLSPVKVNGISRSGSGGRRPSRRSPLNYQEGSFELDDDPKDVYKPEQDSPAPGESEDEDFEAVGPSDWESETYNRTTVLDPSYGSRNRSRSGVSSSRRRLNTSQGPRRRSTKAATRNTRKQVKEAMPKTPPPPSYMTRPLSSFSPEILEATRNYEERKDNLLEPLPVIANQINHLNVKVYAEEGAVDPWASAFQYDLYKQGGRAVPRRVAPYRDLHRLSYPHADDFSSFAENIRWAKIQYEKYGSVWNEGRECMERINRWRRTYPFWASEELIQSGAFPTYDDESDIWGDS